MVCCNTGSTWNTFFFLSTRCFIKSICRPLYLVALVWVPETALRETRKMGWQIGRLKWMSAMSPGRRPPDWRGWACSLRCAAELETAREQTTADMFTASLRTTRSEICGSLRIEGLPSPSRGIVWCLVFMGAIMNGRSPDTLIGSGVCDPIDWRGDSLGKE